MKDSVGPSNEDVLGLFNAALGKLSDSGLAGGDAGGLIMLAAMAVGAGAALMALLLTWRKLASEAGDWSVVGRLLLHGVFMTILGAGALFAEPLVPANETYRGAGVLLACLGAGLIFPVLRGLGLTFVRPRERIEKGSELVTAEKVAKLVKRDGKARIRLGGIPIPQKSEPVHFMMLGGTGSGKSVAINQLLSRAYDDGDVIIVVDSGGDFASRYYDPKRDFILNPFDSRSVPWNPLVEMDSPYDAEALSRSIIPSGTGESKEWNAYAQTFLGACLTVLRRQRRLAISDLMYLVQEAPIEELVPLLAGTAAAAQLTSEKTFGSIRVIATNYMSAYAYLPDAREGAPPFSVKQFVSRGKSGALFITYRDDQLDSLQNLIACAVDVASRTVLSLPPDPRRRVWLVVDEFASIGKIQSIESFAAKARKCGGCLVVGLQSVSQLFDPNRYGEHGGQTLLANLGTWLVLRCSDADTAEYMSRYLGDQRVTRHSLSLSQQNRGGDSRSANEQVSVQRTVMPAELQELAPLTGFLRVAGGYPVAPVKLTINKSRQARVSGYAPREFDSEPAARSRPEAVPASAPVQNPQAPAAPPAAPMAPPLPASEAFAPAYLVQMLADSSDEADQFLFKMLKGEA